MVTPRQYQALELYAKGLPRKEIASVMGIGKSRVSRLLTLNKSQDRKWLKKWQQTPAGREYNRRYAKQWRRENLERARLNARASYRRRKK